MNRLGGETSLYLRQHAGNPVDWYPWGEEALGRALAEDKPILVSIGYAACHWCHVMERESFEDPEVAAFMNARFVCIKVDREERPDVDAMYMDAVTAMTGSGGWPLNCFLMPDGRPFYGGTYYPPQPVRGRPSWSMILERIATLYAEHRDKVEDSASQITAHLSTPELPDGEEVAPLEAFDAAWKRYERRMDKEFGGFGGAPKFPNVPNLEYMLRVAARGQEAEALPLLVLTADGMARGGIFDHLGGGFARYSTDRYWKVPHFEKMLYDNALLPRVYLELHRQTDAPRYAEVVRETLAYLEREMLGPEGGFYAAQDADSEGEEGRFFVWTLAEVEEVLGAERARVFCEVYTVTALGNWEGKNVLHIDDELDAAASDHGLSRAALEARLAEDRALLWARREQRVKPARDEKRVAAWNGLAVGAFARASSVLGEPRYARVAERCVDFLREELLEGASLRRVYAIGADGGVVRQIDGFLEDYAWLAFGLTELFKASGRVEDLELAAVLLDAILERFFDPASGQLYLTSHAQNVLPVRKLAEHDGATPSPAGEACLALLRVYSLTGRAHYREAAEAILRRNEVALRQFPEAVPTLLRALELVHEGAGTVVVVGEPGERGFEALLAEARCGSAPCDNVVGLRVGEAMPGLLDAGLGEGRVSGASPRAYACRGQVCQAPASDVRGLRATLEAHHR